MALVAAPLLVRRRHLVEGLRKGLSGNTSSKIGLLLVVILAVKELIACTKVHCNLRSPRRGVVFFGYSRNVTLAENYVQRIIEVGDSVRRHSPNLPIMLFTNAEYTGTDFDFVYKIPDEEVLPGRQWWTRMRLLPRSAFNEVIAIDSDRYVCNAIEPVFEYLSEYNMLGVSAGILPGLDNGVMVFRNDHKFRALAELWQNEQTEIGKEKDDQQTLARAIDKMRNFRVGVLDQSWQMKYIPAKGQTWRNTTKRRSLVIHSPVKIVAGYSCPAEYKSSRKRIYTGNSYNQPEWRIAYSQDECDHHLSKLCTHGELDWGSSEEVIDRNEYLSRYLHRKG